MPMTLPPPNDDRETLSALFDGELRGDAARFALKRLDHDRAWSESVSRWQLAGDVLRGRGDAAAPAGFAARVGSALAAEARLDAMPAVAAGTGASRRTLGGWMPGAALAASVAVAALFVVRPFDEPAPAPEAAPPAVAAAPTTMPAAAEPRAPQAADGGLDAGASPAAALAGAAAIAAAERPRRAAQRTATGAARDTTNAAETAAQTGTFAVAARDVRQVAAAEATVEPATDPFQPRAAEFGARPWPRAVLTDYRAGGAMTASYGASTTASAPSFYPFEPRVEPGMQPGGSLPAAEAGTDGTSAPIPPSP